MTPASVILSPDGEASALLRLLPAATAAGGWHEAYWTTFDESPAADCLGIVGRGSDPAAGWRIQPMPARLERGSRRTQDVEALARFDGWVYLIGSQYGRPRGPLESRRSFLARFAEPTGTSDSAMSMEVVRDRFRLHRALNDALVASGIPLARLSAIATRGYIDRTRDLARKRRKVWADRIQATDLPINIEGAAFDAVGNLLLGLRFPVTADGHPMVVELGSVEGAFREATWQPSIRAIRVLAGAGSRDAPVGIRDLELDGRRLHVLVGGIDPELVDDIPMPSRRGFEHRVTDWSVRGRRRSLPTRLVRRFGPGQRVEGLASNGAGSFVYVAERLPELDRPEKGRVVALPLPRGSTTAASS